VSCHIYSQELSIIRSVRCPWDCTVDRLAEIAVDHAESGTGIRDSGISAAINSLAIDCRAHAVDLPESASIDNGSVEGTGRDAGVGSVDVAWRQIWKIKGDTEGVEPRCLIPTSEHSSEHFLVLYVRLRKVGNYRRDIILFVHVVDRGRNRLRYNGIDVPECQSEKTITTAATKGRRQFLGAFNGLVRDCNSANGDIILWSDYCGVKLENTV